MDEQRIEQIYQQLGMLQGRTSTRGSSRVGVRTDARVGSGRDDMYPSAFAQYQGVEQPEAVERTGILNQFLLGTGSPVIDTMAKMGWVEERPAPVNVRETIANMAGSLLGWSTVLMLPGIGKGLSAGGAALAGGLKATGMGAKLAGTVGKGMATGAVLGAHSAWTRDKPVGKEMLKSMAFSGAVTAGFHGMGVLARKTGVMRPTAEDLIKAQGDILSTTDEKSMLAALGKLPSSKAGPAVNKVVERLRYAEKDFPSKTNAFVQLGKSGFQDMSPKAQATYLLDAFRDAPNSEKLFEPIFNITKGVTTLDKIMGSRSAYKLGEVKAIVKGTKPIKLDMADDQFAALTKKQKEIFLTLKEASNLGEQFDGYRVIQDRLRSVMRQTLKKYEAKDITELANKANSKVVELYATRTATLQDMTWKFGNRIDDIVNMKVQLPHLSTIPHTPGDKAVLQSLKNAVDKGLDIDSKLGQHPKITEFLNTWQAKTGKSFNNTSLMPKQMAEEYTGLLKSLKASGQTPYTMKYGMSHFPVPEEVLKKDIPSWIKGLTKLPEGTMHLPTNLHEAYALKKDISPILGRFLTPVRHALGEPFTNDARIRMEMHQTTVNTYKEKLQAIFKESGMKKKELTEYGVRLGKALELRQVPGKDSIVSKVKAFIRPEAVKEKVKLAMLPNIDDQLTALSKSTGLTTQRLAKIMSNKSTMVAEAKKAGMTEGSVAKLSKLITDKADLNRMAKEAGLSVKQMQTIYNRTTEAMDDIIKTAEKGKDLKYLFRKSDEIASYHYINEKLLNLPKMKEPAKKELAGLLGLKDTKELDHLYRIKTMFNQMFTDSDIDPNRFITMYMPHFRNFEHVDHTAFLKELKKIGITDKKTINSYKWINEMVRESGDLGYEEDIFVAFSRYVSGYSKKKHFEDLFQTWNKSFKEMNLPKERMALYRDLQQWMIGKPTAAEQQMDTMILRFTDAVQKTGWNPDWGERPTQALSSMLAELQYTGGLGFNPFTAVKNLTQKGLALSSITDDGNPYHGLKWLAKARAFKKTPEGKMIASQNGIVHSRQFTEGLTAQTDAISNFLNRIGAPNFLQKASKTFNKKAFDMFRLSDLSNLDDTFMAKYMYLTQTKGAPMADALNLATSTTMATQFMYGFDSPMLYKGPFGRQLGIFMSWPINWAHLLYTQGTTGQAKEAVATIGTMAVMSQVLSLTGMNFQSIHPVNTARNILPIAMLQGQERFPLAFRTAAAATTAIKELVRGDEVAIDAAFDELGRRMWPLVPAGVMGKRAWDGIELAKNDWKSYDKRGRLRYEADASEGIRGFFGPTVEAHERSQAYEQITRADGAYRRTRTMAIQAFMGQDYNAFEKLQEQLVVNFGKWVTPEDIQQEMKLQQMTSRERQLMSMPESYSEPWLARWQK